jgi:hypothetical protein
LYSSITCLKGSTVVVGLTGGRLFTGTPARRKRGHAKRQRGPSILPDPGVFCPATSSEPAASIVPRATPARGGSRAVVAAG